MPMTLSKRDTSASHFEKADSLSGQAYLLLEREIVTLRLAPGQLLTEGALIDRLCVGRTPVREAIQRLAWEGLVEVRPRSGIRIADLDPADFVKVLEVRKGAEEVLARGAARYALPEHLIAFVAIGERMATTARGADVVAFLDADKAFDAVLQEAAANPYASRFTAPLQTHSRRFWFRLQRPETLILAAERHIALIAAIVARDEKAAVEAVGALFENLLK